MSEHDLVIIQKLRIQFEFTSQIFVVLSSWVWYPDWYDQYLQLRKQLT